MGAPAVPQADVTCQLQLPATSYPKHKIKALLLENIAGTAVDLFRAERFQVVCWPLGPFPCITRTSCLQVSCLSAHELPCMLYML